MSGSAVVFVPSGATGTSQRSRDFVSPSASSVAIVVNSAAPVIADISTTSSLCTIGSGGRSCTVPLGAPVGNDTMAFTLYAGANATGSVLGTGSATTTVVSGQPFTVSVAVGGTIASVDVSAPSSFTQGTSGSVTLTVSAKDSGGNTIIGSAPYASPITLSDSDTSGSTALSSTNVTSPATSVVLSYNGGTVSGGSVTISATAANVLAGSVSPAQVAVSSSAGACALPVSASHLYVSNDGGGNVLQFAPPYTGSGTSLQSVGNPVGIAFDNLGNMFILPFGSSGGTSNAGDVLEFASPYTCSAIATIGAGSFHGPRGIAIDGNRNLYVTDSGNDRVLEFVPPYTAAPTVLLNGTSNLYAIALSPNCNLFITSGSSVLEYAPPYTGAAVATITSVASPSALTFDSTGHLFIADGNANIVDEFNPPYTSAASNTTTLTNGSVPLGLAIDASGNLFVNEYQISSIAEYASPYASAPVRTISGSGLSLPAGIAFGP